MLLELQQALTGELAAPLGVPNETCAARKKLTVLSFAL